MALYKAAHGVKYRRRCRFGAAPVPRDLPYQALGCHELEPKFHLGIQTRV